jgi:hypothetical protein
MIGTKNTIIALLGLVLIVAALATSSASALPTCTTSGGLNLTVTNSTPVMESMNVDIITLAPAGSGCYVRVYDENTTIAEYAPRYPRDTCGEMNIIQSIFGDAPDLIVSDAGLVHKNVWISPASFREDYPYTLYAECGQYCETVDFFVDSQRAVPVERIAENIIFPMINNPWYWMMAGLFLTVVIIIFKTVLKFILG